MSLGQQLCPLELVSENPDLSIKSLKSKKIVPQIYMYMYYT